MKIPLIDIILPIYKPEKKVYESIDSILSQTYTNWNLYIIDDASGDESLIQIKNFYAQNPKITFYQFFENRRAAGCRNFAVKKGKGDYITFIDQDDLWLPNKLDIQVDFLLKNREIEAVHGNMKLIDEDGTIFNDDDWQKENANRRKVQWNSVDKIRTARQIFINPNIRLISSIVSRKLFEKIGGFKENFFGGEDELFWFEVALSGRIGYIDDYLFYRREHLNNTVYKYQVPRLIGYYKSLHFILNKYQSIIADLFSLKEKWLLISLVQYSVKNKNYLLAIVYYIKLLLRYPLSGINLLLSKLRKITNYVESQRHLSKDRTKMGIHQY